MGEKELSTMTRNLEEFDKEMRTRKVVLHEQSNCPLCDSSERELLMQEKNNFDHAYKAFSYLNEVPVEVLRCSDCGFAYNKELPEAWFFTDVLYSPPEDIIWWEHPNELAGKEFILKMLMQNLNRLQVRGTLVDLGASSGRLLYVARESGIFDRIIGIENDAAAVKMARAQELEIIHKPMLEGINDLTGEVDCITIVDVLEHIPNPKQVLLAMHKALKPNGLAYIKVPHQHGQVFKERLVETLGIRPSMMGINFTHINHFDEKSLRRALESIGFSIELIQVSGPELWPHPDTWKKKFSNLLRYSQYLFAKFIRSISPLNLGMNLEVYARKIDKA